MLTLPAASVGSFQLSEEETGASSNKLRERAVVFLSPMEPI